jgi:serine/threonine protein kinase
VTTMTNTNMDIIHDWLKSGQVVRICGQDFRPVRHNVSIERPLCLVKGQAAVYFLQQVPHGHIWLLKIFTPGRRPADDYLQAVSRCLPGTAGFFTCTQRRILTKDHLDFTRPGYKNQSLAHLAEGAVMMPKVPGTNWASIADELREGKLELLDVKRLQMSLSLAKCILMLETGRCSHRDLSSTNVFFDENGRAYLIDWDCLYNPELPFQSNTPIGTMGYIAPFLKTTEGNTDGSSTWCPYADRFALAALITEILLVGPDTASSHEDGSLFSQEQIDTPQHEFVKDHINKLRRISKPCASLAQQAFAVSYFSECPSPSDWIGALKYSLHKHTNRKSVSNRGQCRQFVRVACGKCGVSFKISKIKVEIIEEKGQAPLCRSCLKIMLNKWSAGKAQRNIQVSQVFCEHCQSHLRLPREKLDSIVNKGKPILCSTCLREQMKKWQTEYEKSHPCVTCAECGASFHIKKDKLDVLKHKGRQVLCRDCMGEKLQAGGKSKEIPTTPKSGFSKSLWKLIGRTVNVYSS